MFTKPLKLESVPMLRAQLGDCEAPAFPFNQFRLLIPANEVVILKPNELPNLVGSSQLDNCNYLQWAQYIRTSLKGRKKLSHIEGGSSPSRNYMFYSSFREIWENLIKTFNEKKLLLAMILKARSSTLDKEPSQ
ncbi:hypothetical protein CR513_30800, partial [Mucuna pruriens]